MRLHPWVLATASLCLPVSANRCDAVPAPDDTQLAVVREAAAHYREFRLRTPEGSRFGTRLRVDPAGVVLRTVDARPIAGGSSALIATAPPEAGGATLVQWSEVEGLDGRRGSTRRTVLGVAGGALIGAGLTGAAWFLGGLMDMDSGDGWWFDESWILAGAALGGAAGGAAMRPHWESLWP